MSDSIVRFVDRTSSAYRRNLAEARLREACSDAEQMAEVSLTWDAIDRGETGEPADFERLRKRLDLD